jgi:hypothetical protein
VQAGNEVTLPWSPGCRSDSRPNAMTQTAMSSAVSSAPGRFLIAEQDGAFCR